MPELDMTNSSHQCPSRLQQRTDSNKCTCGIPSLSLSPLQYGTPYGFLPLPYGMDGVSLTHGNPREHIWTFVAAHDEVSSQLGGNCPCTNTNIQRPTTSTIPQRVVTIEYPLRSSSTASCVTEVVIPYRCWRLSFLTCSVGVSAGTITSRATTDFITSCYKCPDVVCWICETNTIKAKTT